MAELTTFIYGLWDPRDGRLRYIGKSNDPKTRLTNHLRAARKKGATNHLRCWLIGVMNDGEKPMLEILEEISRSEWKAVERSWIKQCRDHGIDLVNTCEGGLGGGITSDKMTEETRRKRSEAAKQQWQDPEFRERQILARKWSTKPKGWQAMTEEQRQEFKEKRKTWSPAKKGCKLTEEHKAKIGAANAIALKGRPLPGGAVEKAHEVRWSDPTAKEHQAAVMEKYRDPETGQFLSKEKVNGE